jgi:hypothetical protein
MNIESIFVGLRFNEDFVRIDCFAWQREIHSESEHSKIVQAKILNLRLRLLIIFPAATQVGYPTWIPKNPTWTHPT